LTVPSFEPRHFAGDLAFGGDGHLYATLGDSGVPETSRDTSTLNGSVIRIAVDDTGVEPYTIPPDNPFVGQDGADEIWAYGLRNPFRFSFDRETGDLWIADVGQDAVEAIYMLPGGAAGGQDYGWPIVEGHHCYQPPVDCPTDGITMPVLTYLHEDELGRSVIGGHVYRGEVFPADDGSYVFGDFVSGNVFVARELGGTWTMEVLLETELSIVALGTDEQGELFVVDFAGAVHRLAPSDDVEP
jgi:glucose/arabinose dehydrogenase